MPYSLPVLVLELFLVSLLAIICTSSDHSSDFYASNQQSIVNLNTTQFTCICSGRTEKQALADASNRQQPKVVRRPSKRHQRRESVESMPNGRLVSPYMWITFNP